MKPLVSFQISRYLTEKEGNPGPFPGNIHHSMLESLATSIFIFYLLLRVAGDLPDFCAIIKKLCIHGFAASPPAKRTKPRWGGGQERR